MQPDLAAGPVMNRTGTHQVVVLADPETLLNLTSIQTGLDHFSRRPRHIINDNDVLTEHLLSSLKRAGVLPQDLSCSNYGGMSTCSNRLFWKQKNPQTLSGCGSEGLERKSLDKKMVPKVGVEPTRVSPHAPQACASTNSTTPAHIYITLSLSPL